MDCFGEGTLVQSAGGKMKPATKFQVGDRVTLTAFGIEQGLGVRGKFAPCTGTVTRLKLPHEIEVLRDGVATPYYYHVNFWIKQSHE
jgi:hypothetical protein